MQEWVPKLDKRRMGTDWAEDPLFGSYGALLPLVIISKPNINSNVQYIDDCMASWWHGDPQVQFIILSWLLFSIGNWLIQVNASAGALKAAGELWVKWHWGHEGSVTYVMSHIGLRPKEQ